MEHTRPENDHIMTTVLFIQDLYWQNLGPMYISAALKEAGHRVGMLMTNRLDSVLKNLEGVDIVAFSRITGSHSLALEWIKEIKKVRPEIVSVMGGAHPTFYPEVIEQCDELDFICRGEGEEAMVELCDRFPNREEMSWVENLSSVVDGAVRKNPMRALGDIDDLPYPDRKLYGNMFHGSVQPVLASRGCPYDCSFCFENSFRTALKEDTGTTVSVRYRNPRKVIDELKETADTARIIQFRDESFLSHKNWFMEFLTLYRDEIGVPFTAQIRVNEVTEEKAKLMSEANAHCVYMGIESGNEDIRSKIINKKLKTEHIHRGADLLRKYNIPWRSYNIIGFPEETLEDVYSTIKVNQDIGTAYPWVSMLMPYKGTEIYKYYEEYYDSEDLNNLEWFFPQSAYYKDKQEFLNLQNFFFLLIKFPWLKPLVKQLIKVKPNLLYRLIYQAGYAWAAFRSEGYRLDDFLNIATLLTFRKFTYGPFYEEPVKPKRQNTPAPDLEANSSVAMGTL